MLPTIIFHQPMTLCALSQTVLIPIFAFDYEKDVTILHPRFRFVNSFLAI